MIERKVSLRYRLKEDNQDYLPVDFPAFNQGKSITLSDGNEVFVPRWNVNRWLRLGPKLIKLLDELQQVGLLGKEKEENQDAVSMLEHLTEVVLPITQDIVAETMDIDIDDEWLINIQLSDLLYILSSIIEQEIINSGIITDEGIAKTDQNTTPELKITDQKLSQNNNQPKPKYNIEDL